MNGALQQRLRFIDFLLDAFGYVQARHLMDYFGIASAQATRDLVAYAELAPVNADYVASNRRYERTRNFIRKWP